MGNHLQRLRYTTVVGQTGDTDYAGAKPADEVELLLENARLRDALEPFADDSLNVLTTKRWTTSEENAFLESMLAWETAPVLPIYRWFQPALVLPPPHQLSEAQLSALLRQVIDQLYQKRIVLNCTEHLSDRELYVLIYRDILPLPEKYIENRPGWICWQCVDEQMDTERWLMYYATEWERQEWAERTGQRPPPRRRPPFPRQLPRPS